MDEEPRAVPEAEVDASEAWQQFEGELIDGQFPLGRYLGGSDHSAVFATERQGEKAAIKLVPLQFVVQPSPQSAQLSHPGLVRIFHAGEAQLAGTDCAYVVTEYAAESLARVLSLRALAPEECQEILSSMLQALAHIHEKGLAHGRVKPANILAVQSELKLSSDGLAAVGTKSPLEASPYDAPELADSGVSAAADVWSLGLTIAEALTQRFPDREAIRAGWVVLPENTPPALREIVTHCLYADPRARWTIVDLQTRLQPEEAAPIAEPSSLSSSSSSFLLSPEAAPEPLAEASPETLPKAAFADTREFPAAMEFPSAEEFPSLEEFPPGQEFQATESLDVPEERPSRKRYLIPAILALLLLLAIWAAPRLLNRGGQTPAVPADGEKPADQPATQPPAPEESKPAAPSLEKIKSPIAKAKVPVSGPASSATPDEVVQTVLPFPSSTAVQSIQGTIKVGVKVQVDSAGQVKATSLDPAGPSKYFAAQAEQAARQWKFAPARQTGARRWVLRFEFRKSGTKAVPVKLDR